MIHTNTGQIITDDGVRLGPETERETFLASRIGLASKVSVDNAPWHSYRLPVFRMDSREFGAIIIFHEDETDSISLAISGPAFGTFWAEWSDDNEGKRDTAHKKWLSETTDRDREFSWGSIWVGRDPKTTDAGVTIQYKRNT